MDGNETVHAVIFADDIWAINSCPKETNHALPFKQFQELVSSILISSNRLNCKIIWSDNNFVGSYSSGQKIIVRTESWLLLEVIIIGRGFNVLEDVCRRSKRVDTFIKLIKSWRTKVLSFGNVFKRLFLSKIVPRFTYALVFFISRNGVWITI